MKMKIIEEGNKRKQEKKKNNQKGKLITNINGKNNNINEKNKTKNGLKEDIANELKKNECSIAKKKIKKIKKSKKVKEKILKKKGIKEGNLINRKDEKDEKKKEELIKDIKNENDNDAMEETNLIDVECLWTDLFISKPLLKCLFELKFNHPTLIQKDVIPLVLEGKSVLANSETGSGKTLAFVLPILERLLQSPNIRMRTANVRSVSITKSLILLPTRELALQCHDVIKTMTKYTPITHSLFCGGLDMKQQETEYKKKNDIFICTPGRILDFLLNYSNSFVDFLEIVVFDEADKLLELGFKEECLKILEVCKFKKQILFFSATLTKDIKELVHFSLKNPIFIQIGDNTQLNVENEHIGNGINNGNKNGNEKSKNSNKMLKTFKIAENLNQEFVNIAQEKYRKSVLLYLCSTVFKSNAIIFVNTRREAHYLYLILTFFKFKCTELHGGLTQKMRIKNICQFKKEEVDFLLTTDLASRGLDIEHVKYVINYNAPSNVIKYVHRIGRTARIGKKGTSCTFYVPSEKEHIKKIIKCIKKNKTSIILKRNVSKEHVLHWKNVLKENKNEIKNVVEQEITEREIQKSEKYIDKVKNIILHKDDIMSRPKRTWFLTPVEKMQLKKKALKQEQLLQNGGEEDISEEKKNFQESKRDETHAKQKNGRKNKKKKENRISKHDDYDDDDDDNDKREKGDKRGINNMKAILKQLKINVLNGKDKKYVNSKFKKEKEKDYALQKRQNYMVKKEIRKAKKEIQKKGKVWINKRKKNKGNRK